MNDLYSIQKLFSDALFRVPDYQRGYSWGLIQLEEFWNDLTGLMPNHDHYTGMLSLKEIKQTEIRESDNKWNSEKWLVLDSGYSLYEVVDGQQRLTTLIILINEIISYCKANGIKEINHSTLEKIEEKYLFKSKTNNIIKTYKFGYEEDNPSYLYFKHQILGEKESGKIEETFYTLNLYNAQKYFKEKIKYLGKNRGFHFVEDLFRKITLQLKFNIYFIEDDFNVYIAFETMNNRGKKLSYLELLKNRLIYLSTLFDNDEYDKKKVRDNINETWMDIYHYLGKNKNHPLNDDEFLRNHWMIYFGFHTRRIKGNVNIPFNVYLLNKYFTKDNIDFDELCLQDFDDELLNFDGMDDENNNDQSTNETLTLEKIKNYVNSLKSLIPHWYEMHFPTEDLDPRIASNLYRIKEVGFVNSRPLITVILSKKNITTEEKVECLKNIERYNFLHYRLNSYMSTYTNSVFYNLARDLYYDKISVDDILEVVTDISFLSENNVIIDSGITEKFDRLFKRSGFYSWNTIKYVLYMFDITNSRSNAEQRINPADYFKQDPKDYFSIEHIFPQKANEEYWVDRFSLYNENEQKRLLHTLGNLLPLSKRINNRLQNKSFDSKKERFAKGSISEIMVSDELEWTPEAILNRGVYILEFMEREWDFKIPNLKSKKEILGLDFMINEGDEYIDAVEIIQKDNEKTSTINVSFSEEDFKRLSAKASPVFLDIYKVIDEYILSLSNDVLKNSTKNYISYTNGKTFVELRFYTNSINIVIMSGEYNDPLNKVEKIAESYNWSNMNRVNIYENDDLNYIKKILKQSYEKTFN